MTSPKPRVGLLLLAAEWFWQQNIQGDSGRYHAVASTVDADAEVLIRGLTPHVEVVTTGLVHTVEQAAAAANCLKAANVDLLLICSLMWSEDQPLLKVLAEVPNIPLLVWCYVPEDFLPGRVSMAELFRRSGPVGTLQNSAPLKRLGKRFGFVCGAPSNPRVVTEIREYAEAASIARGLKGASIGLLPYRCELMTGTYVDEFRLMSQLGPTVRYISVGEYASATERVKPAEVERFVRALLGRFEVCGVSDESLYQTARASLGLARLAEEMSLDAIALSDLVPELHRVMKVRPFLCVPDFFDRGRVVGFEGDLAATTGMLIVRRLGQSPPMYTEIFTYDERRNTVLAGHAGMHDLNLADVEAGIRISPDYEYCEVNGLEGAWLEFRGRPGRVTMASFFGDVRGFKMVVSGGESLADGARLEGFSHLLIKLDVPLVDFFERAVRSGLTQHWIVTHEDIRGKLDKLASFLNLEFETI